MLPNRFPDAGQKPEYNAVDATLWYFEAIRSCYQVTRDNDLLSDLFPILSQIIKWYRRGTRFNIQMDPGDGLISAGQSGVQLTWMDAKVGDWVVTPRIGKPVEISALWYNALCSMVDFAQVLGKPFKAYKILSGQVLKGFGRFWNQGAGYCYDLLDGPEGDDDALRPNQLLAVSLGHSPLDDRQARGIVDACAHQLLTKRGLRSLSADHPSYVGRYGGDQRERDAAYHQGTVWGWLIGPFIKAHLRVYRDPEAARAFLRPLFQNLNEGGLGTISEIFDGDAPHAPRGCPAQAWSVAQLLHAWQEIDQISQHLR
jgi:predicted glycogen debranching enzyme